MTKSILTKWLAALSLLTTPMGIRDVKKNRGLYDYRIAGGLRLSDAPLYLVVAAGRNEQLINTAPIQNFDCIRMGNSPDLAKAPIVPNNLIWQHINHLAYPTL